MTDFYVASADPAEESDVDSSVVRAEFAAIAAAFVKVAGYTGNANKPVFVNSGGTALEAITAASACSLLGVGTEDSPTFTGLTLSGILYINDTSNANQTRGITINQGAATDEAISLKATAVAHGATGLTETDTYGIVTQATAAAGGLTIKGFNDAATQAIQFQAYNVSNIDTTKSTLGIAAFEVLVSQLSGTSNADVVANGNLLAVRVRSGGGYLTRFILDADGDSHQDVGTAWTNFDDHDDIALLEDLTYAVTRDDDPIKANFHGFLKYNRAALERSKLVKFSDSGPFVNMSKLTMAHTGAIRQLGRDKVDRRELSALKARVTRLNKQLAALR